MFVSVEHIDHSAELRIRLTTTPTVSEAIYGMLLDAVGDSFTEADVRAALGVPKTTVHVAMSGLVKQGLVAEERIGRTGLYSVNPSDPLARSLKTARAIRRAQVVIEPVRDRLSLAVLFGSASRGEDRRGSDLDLLAVTDEAEDVESELARHAWLQPVTLTPEKHMVLIAAGGTFAKETARGITIWERP